MSDLWLLKVIGAYLLVTCEVGVAAFPRVTALAPLVLYVLFILAGYGVLGWLRLGVAANRISPALDSRLDGSAPDRGTDGNGSRPSDWRPK